MHDTTPQRYSVHDKDRMPDRPTAWSREKRTQRKNSQTRTARENDDTKGKRSERARTTSVHPRRSKSGGALCRNGPGCAILYYVLLVSVW